MEDKDFNKVNSHDSQGGISELNFEMRETADAAVEMHKALWVIGDSTGTFISSTREG